MGQKNKGKRKYAYARIPADFHGIEHTPKSMPVVAAAAVVVKDVDISTIDWDQCYPPTKACMEGRKKRALAVAALRNSPATTVPTYHNHTYGCVCGVCGHYSTYPALMRKSDQA